MRYKDSGVDIDAAGQALARVRSAIAGTWGPQVASDVGSFGGLFRQPDGSYLVSSIDGVGTKLLVALATGRVGGVGADLVNHCVNDILVQGASPLFFLDYFAAGRLDPEAFASVVEGMASACAENGCALIGGETAEMPGVYKDDDFDLAGCIVGQVTPGDLITGQGVRPGMVAYAYRSSGLHTNGYSLARRIFMAEGAAALEEELPGTDGSIADALLAVHRSYLSQVLALRKIASVEALCHITGGGFLDNLPRVLPDHTAVEIDCDAWEVPPLFREMARRGPVDVDEMRRVFNLGLGMIAFAPEIPVAQLATLDEAPIAVGRVVERGEGPAVRFRGTHAGLA